MKPEGDQTDSLSPEDAESVPEAGTSRWQRLKGFFVSRYLRIIDGLSAGLKRLRSRAGKPKEEDSEREERSESRAPPKKAKTPHADEAPAAAPPAPRSVVRSFFIYLLVLILGIIAGMIFSFALLSNMVINQAQKIGDQRDEISQLEKQYSRALESEAKYRKRLGEIESQLNLATQKAGKETTGESGNSPGAAPAAKERPATPNKTGDCTLESGNAENLARCLDEFNRKAKR
ncbi:MAG: hypothetical protein WCV99_15865 [Sterolibacterium sp.]|jgi:hypothetical protein